jgi:2-oxoisovalerate dehydrogenase E2 component (dihydrolipoyl transacylase)
MVIDIPMPQLGESVTEGTLLRWLKKPGDAIAKYEPICEVATDKVNAEVPSTIAGTIREIIANEGEVIQVGQTICRMQAKEAAALPLQGRYSPAVLRLAQEHQIDLASLKGTGQGGRITRQDVLQFIASAARPSSTVQPTVTAVPSPAIALNNEEIEVPLTTVRRTIAQHMVQSKHEVPHAWMMMEADVTQLVQLRQRWKEHFKKHEGLHLTFMPFFIKAVVDALKEFPYLNSVWGEDKIILKKRIHISIAVATEDALYVPVIHHADEKSILGLAKASHQLIQKARAGKLELPDMTDGTFTVNNTGSFGSIASAPIINFTHYPQAAILSCEAIVKRPVIYHDMIAIRDKMNLCLSFDHRILDGWMAGKFLQRVKERLEAYTPEESPC